ncbi:MAG: HAMP domain-containing protein [Cellvibrionaceae bacterium]
MSEKNISFMLSVQSKIIFTTIVIITVILGAYAVYDINRRGVILEGEIVELAKVTAKKLENNLRIPLWDLDSDLVSDAIEAEMLTRDISAIMVFDSNGSDLISGKQRDASWTVLDSNKAYIPVKDEIAREALISNKNETIGRVVVYITPKFKEKATSTSALGLLLTLVFLDVIIFMTLWLVMTNILRNPISKLSAAANQISRGDFSVEIDTNREDEIGVVANSIDRMKVSLNMAIQRLREIEQRRKERLNKSRLQQ